MHAVMGTMRKMENQEMEDKMMVTTKDSRLAAPPNGTAVTRKRILGGLTSGRGKVAPREVDKWKRVAAQKAGGRERPAATGFSAMPPAVSLNGHKVSCSRRVVPTERPSEIMDHRDHAIDVDNNTNTEYYNAMHRQLRHSEDNLPMDLSKRSADEDASHDWRNDEDGYRGDGGRCRGVAMDDDDYNDEIIENRRIVGRPDEPLNLSKTNIGNSRESSGGSHHRWNGHQMARPTASAHSSNHSGESSDDLQRTTSAPSATRPETLQKRVRLEEMVNYIRKCTAAEESPLQCHKMEDHHHHYNNGTYDWSHTNGHHRLSHHYQRHPAATADDDSDDGDQYQNRDSNEEDDDVMEDTTRNGHYHPQAHSRRPDYEGRVNMVPAISPSYHNNHYPHRRRKSSTPYRGSAGTSPPSASLSPGSFRPLHHRQPTSDDEHQQRSDGYEYAEGEAIQPGQTATVMTTDSSNGIRGISYPVLRQQLLGANKRHLVSTQTVNDDEIDERLSAREDKGEDDIADQPDVVRSHGQSQRRRRHRHHTRPINELDEDDDDMDDERHVGGISNQPLLTQQHLHLLTAAAPPIGSQQYLTWSNYAYYANLLQLQGTLAAAGTNSLPNSLPALPLTLSLPLSVNGSGPRSDSPGSIEEDDDDPNTLDLSSPETLNHHKNNGNGGSIGGATNNHKNNGTSGGGLVGIATEVTAANAAMFRKRAPRALTGKHVKHGTGASPTTLLTLRQKIEQKRQQQQASSVSIKPAGGGVHKMLQEKSKSSEGNGPLHKAIKTGTLLQKKAIVS